MPKCEACDGDGAICETCWECDGTGEVTEEEAAEYVSKKELESMGQQRLVQ